MKTKPQVIWTALASFQTAFCFFIGQDTWECQLLKSFNVAKCHLSSGWLNKAIQCSSQYPLLLKIYILSDVIKINQKLWLYLTTCCSLSTSLETNKHDNILFSFSGIPSFHTRINKLCIWKKISNEVLLNKLIIQIKVACIRKCHACFHVHHSKFKQVRRKELKWAWKWQGVKTENHVVKIYDDWFMFSIKPFT